MNRLSKAREKLMTRCVHIFGFEHPHTIQFVYACEHLPYGIRNYILLRNWARTVEGLYKRVDFDLM